MAASAARPYGAKISGERLRGNVARARKGEHFAAFVTRELRDDVSGSPEPIDAQASSIACLAQRSITDEARA